VSYIILTGLYELESSFCVSVFVLSDTYVTTVQPALITVNFHLLTQYSTEYSAMTWLHVK